MARHQQGTYTGDAAAQNISCGWQPDYVRVVNVTDGDASWEWYAGMTAGHAMTANATGDQSRITANGITLYAGDADNPEGFTIGTSLSETGKTFAYVAWAQDDENA